LGLRINFQSKVVAHGAGRERIEVDGHLLMQPRSALGRFMAYRVLRRPERLACIRYEVRPQRGRREGAFAWRERGAAGDAP
jgi:hypothetical protein